MSNEEIHEYYGWLAHRLGFFEEWRESVGEKIKTLQVIGHQISNYRADYARQVFDEILVVKQENGEISDFNLIGIVE
jgi:hypothetical protein